MTTNNICIIWIDKNIFNNENQEYVKRLKKNFEHTILFTNVDSAIYYMKEKINFISPFLITSGSLYQELIAKFTQNMKDISVIPKFIIFTRNYKLLYKDVFFNSGNLHTSFFTIENYINKEIELMNKKILPFNLNPYDINNNYIHIENDEKLTFERIDCLEKLYYPVYYKALIDTRPNIDKINEFTNNLLIKYENNKQIFELFSQFKSLKNIPLELLCKFYARLYTSESNFYKDMNQDLMRGYKEKFIEYIKVMYEGNKLNVFPNLYKGILYRTSIISKKEIRDIIEYKNKRSKDQDFPFAIVYSRAFLSFTKSEDISHCFKNSINNSDFYSVSYILKQEYNYDKSLCTHADIEKFSFFEKEREVLFFPLTCFEINNIEIKKEKNNCIIYLNDLGRYEAKLEKAVHGKINSIIPNSKFEEELIITKFISKNEIKSLNAISLNEKVNKYKKKYHEEEFQSQNKKFLNNLTLNNEPSPNECYNQEMDGYKNSINYFKNNNYIKYKNNYLNNNPFKKVNCNHNKQISHQFNNTIENKCFTYNENFQIIPIIKKPNNIKYNTIQNDELKQNNKILNNKFQIEKETFNHNNKNNNNIYKKIKKSLLKVNSINSIEINENAQNSNNKFIEYKSKKLQKNLNENNNKNVNLTTNNYFNSEKDIDEKLQKIKNKKINLKKKILEKSHNEINNNNIINNKQINFTNNNMNHSKNNEFKISEKNIISNGNKGNKNSILKNNENKNINKIILHNRNSINFIDGKNTNFKIKKKELINKNENQSNNENLFIEQINIDKEIQKKLSENNINNQEVKSNLNNKNNDTQNEISKKTIYQNLDHIINQFISQLNQMKPKVEN